MTSMSPYLTFDGACAAAMKDYQRVLGGELHLMEFAGSPMEAHVKPADLHRVMHARLEFDGGVLMASDCMTGMEYRGIEGSMVSVTFDDAARARQVFDALADGGRVTMCYQKTFWAEGFGMLVDRHGASWMVSAGLHPPRD